MKTSSLSKWFAGSTHRAFDGHTDLATRLALAMTPVASLVRVIDDGVPAMTVEWADVETDDTGKSSAMSYTNFGRNKIAINPVPIIEASKDELDNATAIDVCSGFAMHEASHSQHTKTLWPILLTKDAAGKEIPAFRPMRLAVYLLNLVEDVRIEGLTSKRWPGFAPYFDAVLDYMWDRHVEPTKEPEFDKIAKRIRTVYMACRYPSRWKERLPATEAPEVAWWSEWQDDYLTGKADAGETIQRGLDHLREDEETRQDMQGMEAQEKAAEEAGENLRQMIEQMMKDGIDGAPIVCINEDGTKTELDAETSEKVRKMIREQLTEERTPHPDEGARNPAIHITRPEETNQSKRAFIGRPNAMVEAMRASLVFRAAAPEHTVKLQKSGQMDDEELYRWGMDDFRVFSERIIETKPDALMGLLVDMSASMAGQKLNTAQELAQIFVWALHDQQGVETRVWGHTGDSDETESVEMFRLWEKGDNLSRLGLINTLDHSNNYDSHAQAWCVHQMKDHPAPTKFLFVLSDGQPSGSGYGGRQAEAHVHSVVAWAKSLGITIWQIAIDSAMDPARQQRMFGSNWTPYTTTANLPRQLARLMARFT